MDYKDILIIDDDEDLSNVLVDLFTDNGYRTAFAYDLSSASEMLSRTTFKLVVLDINLPDGTGFELCEELRKITNIPILFISARTSDTDKITGLDMGGDDYVAKPFSLGELLSRVKAHLRRSYTMDVLPKHCHYFGDACVDVNARSVVREGKEVELSIKEFDLLTYLLENKNTAISKETLFDEVWGAYHEAEPSTVTVHIRWLREKLEDDPSNPKYIKTVWGVGYKLEVGG